VDSSSMRMPTQILIKVALENGIPISVQRAHHKIKETLLAMMKRLQGSGDPARVKDALERGQAYLGQLANLQGQLQLELSKKSTEIKNLIDQQKQQVIEDLRSWKGPLITEQQSYKTFMGYLAKHIKQEAQKSPTPGHYEMAMRLVKEQEPITFKDKTLAEQVLSILHLALRRAIEEYLLNRNETVPEDLRAWSRYKKNEIISLSSDIQRNYEDRAGISPNKEVLKSMQLSFSDASNRYQQLSFSYNHSIQQIIRKTKSRKPSVVPNILKKKDLNMVDPKEVRKLLHEQANEILEVSKEILAAQIDHIVSDSLKPFIEDNIQEVVRLQDIVKSKIIEVERFNVQQQKPRVELISKLEVIEKQTIKEDLPQNFQSAEYLRQHGFLD